MNIALIARKARVSTATVSRTLNNSPLVREKTATRIRKVIEELGYIPNGSARSLSSGRSNLLGRHHLRHYKSIFSRPHLQL